MSKPKQSFPEVECKYGISCNNRTCTKEHFDKKLFENLNQCIDESYTRHHPDESSRIERLHGFVMENECMYKNLCLNPMCDKNHPNEELLIKNRIFHIAGVCDNIHCPLHPNECRYSECCPDANCEDRHSYVLDHVRDRRIVYFSKQYNVTSPIEIMITKTHPGPCAKKKHRKNPLASIWNKMT